MGAGVLRSTPAPLRHGAAVVAVTGGALSLVVAVTPALPMNPGVAAAALADPVARPAAEVGPTVTQAVLLRSSVQPVVPVPDVLDATVLVKAVQIQETLAVEQAAATQRAAAEAEQEAQAAQQHAAAVAAKTHLTHKADSSRRAATARPATGRTGCGMDTSGLGAVKPFVRDAAKFLGCLFGEPTTIGVAGRAGASDHPGGRAVDFMVDRATGDALAACALRNQAALGITYVIWRQRINTGGGWKTMEDRGGITANHYDHVHISFGSGAGDAPVTC